LPENSSKYFIEYSILRIILTQRFEKCVERTVLYGNIIPKTPNGTFCAFPVVFIFGLFDVLFIHIAVVITKYICDVVIDAVVVDVVPLPPFGSMK
jgi:hypothetical protein